jgi:peptidoglycan/LPS O-acetylase OafA/YrhL
MPASNALATPGQIGDSPNLDLLRSAAVSFVVIFHTALFFGGNRVDALLWPLGHWGVLMFFVHTSLVLMLSLERQIERQPRRPLFWQFMLRRLFRIAPLATVVILVIVALRLPVGHLHDHHFQAVPLTLAPVLENLLFIQDITRAQSVEAPLWSLPYEMQMYLVLPALFVLVRRLSSDVKLIACWAVLATACLVSMRTGLQDRFDMLIYVPCFLSGILAYRLTRLPHRKWPFAAWVATLIICSVFYLLRPTLGVGWVCCLALGVAVSRCTEMASGAVARASHLIARYSYGVYLSHFVCIWFVFVALPGLSLPTRILLFVILLVAVPVALYHTVEAPMMAWGSRVARRAGAATLTSGRTSPAG